MILRGSPSSPFARKVLIAAHVLGLADRVSVQTTDLNDPAEPLRQQNPLGKIPTLILDDGSTWYDSRVILELLDHIAGGGIIIPRDAPARFAVLRLQALCDGMLDACVLIVYESRYRPKELHVQSWLERQADKVARGFDALEAAPPTPTPTPDVGQIALACVLGYHDLRFAGAWRNAHPRLVDWLDRFAAQVPAYEATKVAA